jgi:NAD+ synthase
MTDRFRLTLAQINPTVGDIAGNLARSRAARADGAREGSDLVVLPELALAGYPPEDLVLKPDFQDAIEAAARALAADTADGGPGVLVGAPWRQDGRLHNAALLLDRGTIVSQRFKHDLPNYGVFDEKRVFASGPLPGPMVFRGVRLGVMICEDMWTADAAECLEESGAEILIVPNGSPYESDKADERLNLALARVGETRLPLVYVNQVGGQDELVFDGASFVLNADHALAVQAPSFEPASITCAWRRGEDEAWRCEGGDIHRPPEGLEAVYRALVLGLRDYVAKNRFPGVLIGLSGGIDSALTAAIAVDALGSGRVRTVMMPSRFTSTDSLDDAAETARLLSVRHDSISIEPAIDAFARMLAPAFAGGEPGVAEENIQSRCRGLTLMALSNKFGHMVVSTGNKSEMSAGYATLYGDMCGGFAVLKDVYKTTVFDLARWRNQATVADMLGPRGRVMPERVITKPPSAELRADQRDEDALGPYAVLDRVLGALIEGERRLAEIAATGLDEANIRRIWRLLDLAEYKRRQAPPGVKITRRAFGRDRRYPITNGFRGP